MEATNNLPIRFEELPTASQAFIKAHFADETPRLVMVEKALTSTAYTVRFASGIEIDFLGNGDWKEIEGEGRCISAAFLPEAIRKYLNAHHAGCCITEINREWHKYEVELSGDLELTFNSQGEFLRYDD